LDFFFGHWIACPLFCTFSLTIGLSTLFWTFSFVIGLPDLYFVLYNPMAKEKVQNKGQAIQWPKKKYKIKYRQSNDQRKSTK
jgi:hypothetical protein